mgnify:CR=1 FL=1
MQKQKNKEQGITLIALVVTIIILIILAGVSISMIVGENGIITQAQKAAKDTEQANLKEKLDLIALERELNQYTSSSEVADETDIFLEMMGDKEITQEDVNSFNEILESYGQQLITISNAADIQKIGTDENYPLDGLYVLLDDISLEGQNWTPIGTEENPFTGIFNGNNKAIDALTINGSSLNSGLFSANKGSIKNVILTNVSISSQYARVGGVVGINLGMIENCHTQSGSISRTGEDSSEGSQTGGICGLNREGGIIQNCTNASNVTGEYKLVGGICGYSYGGDISNCENAGEIYGTAQIGGIVGDSEGLNENNISYVKNCKNHGIVNQAQGTEFENVASVGGIVGTNYNYSIIEKCYNEGTVTGEKRNIGGIAGSSYYIVQECENHGQIENIATDENYARVIGGIVGYSGGNILNCKNTGNIVTSETAGTFIGGIVGHQQVSGTHVFSEVKVEQCSNSGTVTGFRYVAGIAGRIASAAYITNCYNTGNINGSERVGGIVGDTLSTSFTITNVYNQGNVTTTGQYAGGIAGVLTSPLENSYNTGTVTMISSNTTLGGIGTITTQYIGIDDVKNCYYLDTSCSKAFGNSNIETSETVGSKTDDEMKTLADLLGEGFKNITDGYPKLSWE